MNFEPQTYEELIRMKRCVELTKYYEVTEEELWEIYHFLEQEPEAFIKGGRQNTSVNGFMIDTVMSQDVVAGKKAITAVTFLSSSLEENSITDITSVETSFHIFDTEDWSNEIDTDPITINF